jgi:hypothetical protein
LRHLNLFILSIFISSSLVQAQGTDIQYKASNRLLYRLADKNKEESFDNWLDVDYTLDNFLTGLRVELHQPSNPTNSVESISQRYFQFHKDWLKIRVGNFYKRLGKGLIFQAFEMQNIALDRIQQSFVVDRNVDGLLMEISSDLLDINLLSGKPLWTKSDIVRGGELQCHPYDWALLGGSYLRINSNDNQGQFKTELASGQVGLSLSNIEVYVEYAKKRVPSDKFLKNGKALYLSSNIYGSNFGLSFEYKDYRDFAQPLNNPPTLVKQHFLTLLNRHTHTIFADDEIGFQIETVFTPWTSTSFIANLSRSGNHDGDELYKFQEIYSEVKQEIVEKFAARFVYDQSFDRLVGDKDRKTSALELDYFIDKHNSLLLDIQVQRIEKSTGNLKYNNQLFLLAYSRSPFLTIGFQYEHTTDNSSDRKEWLAGTLNIKLGQSHDLFVTYGQRRAGLVCSGGYCQLVPEFKGLELRLNSRF